MLEIRNLTIFVNETPLIENLSFTINKNERLAVIGEEGNGKSTLLKAIVKEAPYAHVTGSIQTFHNHIGYVKQALDDTELFLCGKQYLFQDEEEWYEHIADFYQLLSTLQLDDSILEKPLSVLSGGEKVKIQFLKLLLHESNILLLDEPTNDLDLNTLQWLEQFLNNCTLPVLFISHDETLLQNCATHIVHIEQRNKHTLVKHTLYQGHYDDYVNSRLHNLAKERQIANKEKAQYKKKQEQLNNIRNAVHDALNDTVRNPGQGALLKKKMRNIKAQEKRFEKEGYATTESVEEEIHFFFNEVTIPSRKEILFFHQETLEAKEKILASPIHLEIYGPKHIVILGHNGCGKSTLLKQLYPILQEKHPNQVGYMPQNYDDLLAAYDTPIDFLCPSKQKEEISLMRQWMGSMNFTRDEMIAPIQALSGGSKAKLILLSLIKNNCSILVLDEPTRNVSPLSNPVIRNALTQFQGCIISVSHDRKYIHEVCDTIYQLDENGLHEINE